MKRYALILEASRAKGQKPIDGCKRDAERFENWLKNPAGGAWNADEVKVINNPWEFELRQVRAELDSADFAIVTFSGHGRIVQDAAGRRRQMITIGDGKEIDFATLKPQGLKNIMSCDACREVHLEARVEKRLKAAALVETFAEGYTRADYRRAFERAVTAAPQGTYTMFACSPDEYAGDDVLNGGYFTDSLLSGAADWAASGGRSAVLTIEEAFQIAARLTVDVAQKNRHRQNPLGSPNVRAGLPFPFAIRLG